LFSTQRQLADDLANPAHLLLDDEWDVEPGDDRDIRDPEAILARMPGLLLTAGPEWMKLDPHEHQIWDPSQSVFKGALTPVKASAPPKIEQVAPPRPGSWSGRIVGTQRCTLLYALRQIRSIAD
jgi:hypothetical protein